MQIFLKCASRRVALAHRANPAAVGMQRMARSRAPHPYEIVYSHAGCWGTVAIVTAIVGATNPIAAAGLAWSGYASRRVVLVGPQGLWGASTLRRASFVASISAACYAISGISIWLWDLASATRIHLWGLPQVVTMVVLLTHFAAVPAAMLTAQCTWIASALMRDAIPEVDVAVVRGVLLDESATGRTGRQAYRL
jgi:hypothetical protein